MQIETITQAVKDAATVGRVFGQPYEIDGVTVIPVARVGGGGGGGGTQKEGVEDSGGAGFGVGATPVGAYVVKDGEVRFVPALDVTTLASRAGGVLVVGLIAWRSVGRAKQRRKAKTAVIKARARR